MLVSGTTATHGAGGSSARGDPGGQTVYILDKIQASIEALGGTLEDVVRTRVYLATTPMGAGLARPRPLSRPRPPGQHAGRDR